MRVQDVDRSFFFIPLQREMLLDKLSGFFTNYAPLTDLNLLRLRTIFTVDAHRDDGKRLVMRTEEKLTAFGELESAIRASLAAS
jgi:hypothetical protein